MNYAIKTGSSQSVSDFAPSDCALLSRLGLSERVLATTSLTVLPDNAAVQSPDYSDLQITDYQNQWIEINPDSQFGSREDQGDFGKFLASLFESLPQTILLTLPATLREELGGENCDRILFDLGLVRLRDDLREAWLVYLRSDWLEDLSLLGSGSSERRVTMTSLGSNGRFANQLFQYVFMRLYGLRHNCQIETPHWIGRALYGFDDPTCQTGLKTIQYMPFVGSELGLWYSDNPPINVDFWGYFQVIPKAYRRHKKFIQRLLRPIATVSQPIENWIKSEVGEGATTVGIHIRRGDYVKFGETATYFQTIAVAAYRRSLAELWPSLTKPRLIIATDAPELVAEFSDYQPLVVPAPLLSFDHWSFFPDFYALCYCDNIFVVNSSFSRMASLLAKESTRAWIIDIKEQKFIPYQAWDDVYFWDRFEEFPE
ncbi:MAG: hypothetical protein QM523_00780 [Candidatus Pacebacteria bacterium]|nr:hypothetical protein [Candidatus Paceibacterota bacterium]